MSKREMSANPEGLRFLRDLVGLSQYQLAQLAGVADSTVALIEIGRRQPTREMAEKLTAVFTAILSERNKRTIDVPLAVVAKAAPEGDLVCRTCRGSGFVPKVPPLADEEAA